MAAKIQAALSAAGASSDLPAVVASAVTRPNEQRWIGRLDEMAGAVASIGVDEPVLIGIGAAFRQALAAEDAMPDYLTATPEYLASAG